MAAIPHQWDAYASIQSKLAATNSIKFGAALEDALNVIHRKDFRAGEANELEMLGDAATAARRDRRREALCRQVKALSYDGNSPEHPASNSDVVAYVPLPEDAFDVRRELLRISNSLSDRDWNLLIDVAAGASYSDLARSYSSTPTALRSRVCRLRQQVLATQMTNVGTPSRTAWA